MRSIMMRAGAVTALALVAAIAIGCAKKKEPAEARDTKPEGIQDTQANRDEKPQSNERNDRPEVLPDALLVSSGESNARAEEGEWGTVKGKVLYDAKADIPENKEATVSNDKAFCLAKGKIYQNEWVVDKKTRGVKWCLVWLSDVKDPKKTDWDAKLIHPDLKEVPKTLTLDQPICTFVPRVIAVREGTKVTYKNSAEVAHNVRMVGGDEGPNINQLIPPGKELEVGSIKARFMPFSYSCTIHPWMKGWIASFNHPYAAVTNEKGEFEIAKAPPGKYRLQVWQESYGFVQKNKNDRGVIITIKPKETTEVKAIEIKKGED